jgi:hypothetical protein
MTRKVQLVILCEDQQQSTFAFQYFIKRGFHPRKIRVEVNPKGKGSGEQYVRELYPREVAAYRNPRVTSVLAVVIDADRLSVNERLQQLDEALRTDDMPVRQDSEKIAVFVPRRNIETWIAYGQGQEVDEETAYPKLSRPGDCKPIVKTFVDDICQNDLASDAPPSLHHACVELARIL